MHKITRIAAKTVMGIGLSLAVASVGQPNEQVYGQETISRVQTETPEITEGRKTQATNALEVICEMNEQGAVTVQMIEGTVQSLRKAGLTGDVLVELINEHVEDESLYQAITDVCQMEELYEAVLSEKELTHTEKQALRLGITQFIHTEHPEFVSEKDAELQRIYLERMNYTFSKQPDQSERKRVYELLAEWEGESQSQLEKVLPVE